MKNYRYSCPFTADDIILHDTYAIVTVSGCGEIGIEFEDGFTVTEKSVYNISGRCLQTGSSFILLENAELRKGTYCASGLPFSDIGSRRVFICDFIFEKDSSLCRLIGNYESDSEPRFADIELEFAAADVICFWNEYIGDSWIESDRKTRKANSAMQDCGLINTRFPVYESMEHNIFFRFIGKNECCFNGQKQCVSDFYALYYSSDPEMLQNGLSEKYFVFKEELTACELGNALTFRLCSLLTNIGLIEKLKQSGVAFTEGLTPNEIERIENIYGFHMPSSLRVFYMTALPDKYAPHEKADNKSDNSVRKPFSGEDFHMKDAVTPFGSGEFTKWNDFSEQNIMMNRLFSGISDSFVRDAKNGCYWNSSWGEQPDNADDAEQIAARQYKNAPYLIRIFEQYYMPALDNCDSPPVIQLLDSNRFCYAAPDLQSFLHAKFIEDPPLTQNSFNMTSYPYIPFWSDIIDNSFAFPPYEYNRFYTADSFQSIGYMLNCCNGFHDFFLLGSEYSTGDYLSSDGSEMHISSGNSILMLRFCGWSIRDCPTVELRFSGVREFNLTSRGDYPNEILNVSVSAATAPDSNGSATVKWSAASIGEPGGIKKLTDCIIADKLEWRITERLTKQPRLN